MGNKAALIVVALSFVFVFQGLLVASAAADKFGIFDQYGIATFNRPCKATLKNWKVQQGWKAIAVSGIHKTKKFSITQFCGWSWAMPDKEMAEREALKSCIDVVEKYALDKKRDCKLTHTQPNL